METKELENYFISTVEKKQRAVFTDNELRNFFVDKSEDELSEALSKAVESELVIRATESIYIYNNSGLPKVKIELDLVRAFRPDDINYLSLEEAAHKWGFMPCIQADITIMTTGSSYELIIPDFGRYIFTHTPYDVRKDLEAGRIIVYDDRISLAKPDIVVRDLEFIGRHVDVIEWDCYEFAMEEAAAMPV